MHPKNWDDKFENMQSVYYPTLSGDWMVIDSFLSHIDKSEKINWIKTPYEIGGSHGYSGNRYKVFYERLEYLYDRIKAEFDYEERKEQEAKYK